MATSLPKRSEIVYERVFVDFVRAQHFKDTTILNECLLPDVWHLVCSYLHGFYDTIHVSLPAPKLFCEWEYTTIDQIKFRRMGITKFYGPTNGAAYSIRTSRHAQWTNVQGVCPFDLRQLYNCLFIDTTVFWPHSLFSVDISTRIDRHVPKEETSCWSTWQGASINISFSNKSELLRAIRENVDLSRAGNFFSISKGKLVWQSYNALYLEAHTNVDSVD